MRSLPSSGERRLPELRQRLVLNLYLRRGEFWDAVRGIRARWRIAPKITLPPRVAPWNFHLPPDAPRFVERDEEGYDEWITFDRSWRVELRDLHDAVILPEGRLKTFSYDTWSVFLSACVVFDPPVPGLVEFAERGALGLDAYPAPAGNGPDYAISLSPIVQMQDADKEAKATEDFWLGVVNELVERYVEPQGHNAQQVLDEVLHASPAARKRWERRVHAGLRNEARAYIEVRPETTEQDVRSAYRMLAAAHEKRPKSGRPGRNLLAAMECAVLHDRCGWTYERIAEHCGWHDYTAVSKYVAEGRKILEGTGQN